MSAADESSKKKRRSMLREVGGRTILDNIDWDLVSEMFGFKRNGEQCRHKW